MLAREPHVSPPGSTPGGQPSELHRASSEIAKPLKGPKTGIEGDERPGRGSPNWPARQAESAGDAGLQVGDRRDGSGVDPQAERGVDGRVVDQHDQRREPLQPRVALGGQLGERARPRFSAMSLETSARRVTCGCSSAGSRSRTSRSRPEASLRIGEDVGARALRARTGRRRTRPGCGSPRAAPRRWPAASRSRSTGRPCGWRPRR